MNSKLDDLITALAASPADRALDGLEAEISREVAGRRREARTLKAMTPVRLAAIAASLVMGVSAGGAAALAGVRSAHPAGAFAAGTQLAPSTLLEAVG